MSITTHIFEGMQYAVRYPESYTEGEKYPVIMFLHGAGTRGEDISNITTHSFLHRPDKWPDFKFIIVAPLCHENTWFDLFERLKRFSYFIAAQAWADNSRFYLTGNSMGGYGTWELSLLRPDWFAASMPICGGSIPGMAKQLIGLPIRTFHGLCDKTVDPIESLQMAKAVNCFGGHCELILFPHLEHNCWDTVYTTEENYDWLLSHTLRSGKAEEEKLFGEIYG